MVTVYAVSTFGWVLLGLCLSRHLDSPGVLAGSRCPPQGPQLHRLLHLQSLLPSR